MPRGLSRILAALALTTTVGVTSCISPASLLAPELVDALSGSGSVASLPGNADALLVAVENRTDRVAEILISYRDSANGVQTYTAIALAGSRTATALPCPVNEITVGDVTNLANSGVQIILGQGGVDDPRLVVEPFGVLLRNDVNYTCGNEITFAVLPSSVSRSGFQVYAFVRAQ
jgi:hypothetical protein